MEKKTKSNRISTLIIVAIFVGVFLYNVFNPAGRVLLQVESDEIVLSGYEDVAYHIPLDSVESFTYMEDVEYPVETKKLICGTYSNEQWGDYVLYVSGRVSSCIVADTQNGVYVFNYESDATTKSLHEALVKLL